MSAQLDCRPPQAPVDIPDGQTADERDMLATMYRLRRYNTDVETYLKSLAIEAAAHRITPATHNRLHNEAVDRLTAVVSHFNRQVRVYKSRPDAQLTLRARPVLH